MLKDLSKRLEESELTLEVTDKAKELLAKEGFDPEYGARPLRRAIQKLVEDNLAEELLKGNFKAGDVILVDAEEKEIKITKK